MRFSTCVMAILVALLGMYSMPAFAYLDPGTGSMLVQGLIGAIAAVALTARLYWHKVKALFRSKNPNRPVVEPPPNVQEDEQA